MEEPQFQLLTGTTSKDIPQPPTSGLVPKLPPFRDGHYCLRKHIPSQDTLSLVELPEKPVTPGLLIMTELGLARDLRM